MKNNDMQKIAEVLETVPTLLRAMAQEVKASRARMEELEKQAKAETLVAEMEERGFVDPGLSAQEKIAAVLNSGDDAVD